MYYYQHTVLHKTSALLWSCSSGARRQGARIRASTLRALSSVPDTGNLAQFQFGGLAHLHAQEDTAERPHIYE